MRIVYTGPHPAVTVPSAGLTVERDEPVDVDQAVGKALLRQGTWEAVKPPRKPRKRANSKEGKSS